MRHTSLLWPLLAAAAGVLAASAAPAQGVFDQPYYGGGYAPAPGYAYGGYGGNGGYGGYGGNGGYGGYGGAYQSYGGVAAVGYDQGYYQGGYQYPAGGYGGGDYRRAAYTAADVYVSAPPPSYARPCARAPRLAYPVRGYAPPVGGSYTVANYRRPNGPRRRCHCETLY
ncbi:MAG: hypothetical protein ACR652_00745 [Methylocystis sp.]|uniref:hypothetical protein n=1 Tax=Methylocystis sp. TaxID=1911079 RepID=UPI003DA25584